ncbi:MAG: ATP synthase F1 subunit epsilon [Cytophagales bacterium]|nr:ATP synthase F1 subunit epsilon [Cytophagales bacterium]MDW8383161.1 ATP synthase F1 subunit epsilon [Flammeovirgaceae bacterium]
MYLEVITPDKKIFSGEVNGVLVPGAGGSFEMLNNHAAIISSLSKGKLRINSKESGVIVLQIDGGIVEMKDNKVIVLVEKVVES